MIFFLLMLVDKRGTKIMYSTRCNHDIWNINNKGEQYCTDFYGQATRVGSDGVTNSPVWHWGEMKSSGFLMESLRGFLHGAFEHISPGWSDFSKSDGMG